MITDFTQRESEVLSLLARGLSNREIANQLCVEISTVKWYNRQIYNKLGAANRREAVHFAHKYNLLTPPTPPQPQEGRNGPRVLPAQTTPFVGRYTERNDVTQLVQNMRLVTILGIGGMGKTRLALAVAEQAAFADGVFFVPLAVLDSAAQLVQTIGNHTGCPFYSNDNLQRQLTDYLREKSLLLVLDNFENLLTGATLVSDLLEAAPNLHILITSRERLNLRGETVYVIDGLTATDAHKLFEQSAQRVMPHFELHDNNLDLASEICDLAGRMPLGIELAAGWLDVISLQDIQREIQQSLDVLQTDMHDVPDRHRSVRAAFEPTWKRLTDRERQVFMKFAIFRDGATREAIVAVTGADLHILTHLVNRALIQRNAHGRYMMHELMRQYAVAKLRESGTYEQVEADHVAYFAHWTQHQQDNLISEHQHEILDGIEADYQNVLAAWQWGLSHTDKTIIRQMTDTFIHFCRMRNRLELAGELFTEPMQQFAERPETQHLWAHILIRMPGRPSNVTPAIAQQVLALYSDEPLDHAYGLARLGVAYILAGQFDEAETHLTQSREQFQALGCKAGILLAQYHLFYLSFRRHGEAGAYPAALEYVELARQMRSDFHICHALQRLTSIEMGLGYTTQAEQHFEEIIRIATRLGDNDAIAGTHQDQAGYACLCTGQFDRAEYHAQQTLKMAKRYGFGFQYPLLRLCTIAFMRGDVEKVAHYLPEAEIALERGGIRDDEWLGYLANGMIALGRYEDARPYLTKALYAGYHHPTQNILAFTLVSAALLKAHDGEPEIAVKLMAFASVQALAQAWWFTDVPTIAEGLAALKAEMTPKAFDAAWQIGIALTHAQLPALLPQIMQNL